jgi:hypothetical protein
LSAQDVVVVYRIFRLIACGGRCSQDFWVGLRRGWLRLR